MSVVTSRTGAALSAPVHIMTLRWVAKRAAIGFLLLFAIMGSMAWLMSASIESVEATAAAIDAESASVTP